MTSPNDHEAQRYCPDHGKTIPCQTCEGLKNANIEDSPLTKNVHERRSHEVVPQSTHEGKSMNDEYIAERVREYIEKEIARHIDWFDPDMVPLIKSLLQQQIQEDIERMEKIMQSEQFVTVTKLGLAELITYKKDQLTK